MRTTLLLLCCILAACGPAITATPIESARTSRPPVASDRIAVLADDPKTPFLERELLAVDDGGIDYANSIGALRDRAAADGCDALVLGPHAQTTHKSVLVFDRRAGRWLEQGIPDSSVLYATCIDYAR